MSLPSMFVNVLKKLGVFSKIGCSLWTMVAVLIAVTNCVAEYVYNAVLVHYQILEVSMVVQTVILDSNVVMIPKSMFDLNKHVSQLNTEEFAPHSKLSWTVALRRNFVEGLCSIYLRHCAYSLCLQVLCILIIVSIIMKSCSFNAPVQENRF